MKLGSRKSWRSVMPLPLTNKSTSNFCMFPKTKLNEFDLEGTPVYLNVYDLTPINRYLSWAGLGAFHSGVEVHGTEYAFGAHKCPTSGMFEVEPRQCPCFKFRKSIFIGTTHHDPTEIDEFFELESTKYKGNSYHLVAKNCNHFCSDICLKLTTKRIPEWVNRLARIGSVCNCLLPKAFRPSLRHNRKSEIMESTTKRQKSSFCSFSSFSRNSSRERIRKLSTPTEAEKER